MVDELPKPSKAVGPEVVLLMLKGMSEEDAIATVNERVRINQKAQTLVGKPINDWPSFTVEWDEDPSCYHFSQDGLEVGALAGDKIGLVRVKLKNLDTVLQDYNLRTPEQVWGVGDDRKAAKVIVHCSEGRKLSPVWVVPTTPGKVGLTGGNHRLAIARAKRVEELPIIFREEDREKLKAIFPELSTPVPDAPEE